MASCTCHSSLQMLPGILEPKATHITQSTEAMPCLYQSPTKQSNLDTSIPVAQIIPGRFALQMRLGYLGCSILHRHAPDAAALGVSHYKLCPAAGEGEAGRLSPRAARSRAAVGVPLCTIAT